MPKKISIKTRVSAFGRNVTLGMTPAKLEEIIQYLPEGSEDRKILEQIIAKAEDIKKTDTLRANLYQPFSPENLNRFGWTLSENDGFITGGVRQGDFRLTYQNDKSGWTFGPTGAFDRENPETQVMKNASQAGVFCKKHNAYMLMDPTFSNDEAWEQVNALITDWTKVIPKKLKNHMAEDESHPDLPEGARIHTSGVPANHTRSLQYVIRTGNNENTDTPLYAQENKRVDVIEFDARLIVNHYAQGGIMNDPSWGYGQRVHHPRWDSMHYLFDDPLCCVMGKVWGAATNIEDSFISKNSLQHYIFLEKEQADELARYIAIDSNLIDGEQGNLPQPVPAPKYGKADKDNPFT